MPRAVYALTVGAFGIGTTEFVIMGLLLQVAADLNVSIAAAGLLISGYALGVFAGAPLLTLGTARMPRKSVLLGLMGIFIVGNAVCALSSNYAVLMTARVITALAHGTFFGVGAVVATSLVAPDKKASAISVMFTGLTLATLLGVPLGAALGLHLGWRATFWAVAALGVLGFAAVAAFVPHIPRAKGARHSVRREVAAVANKAVLAGLSATVLSWAGVFAVFTYIQPILTRVTGFSEEAVSPILLMLGAGMIAGNFVGGRFADKRLRATLVATILALAVVLGLMTFAIHHKILAVLFVGLLGAGAFATVAPLQLRVLQKAEGAGQTLASSLNIGAFNFGNAIGAWLGGLVITHGPGLVSIPWVAALVSASALAIVWLDRETATTAPLNQRATASAAVLH